MISDKELSKAPDSRLIGEMKRRGWFVSNINKTITRRLDCEAAAKLVQEFDACGVRLPGGPTALPILEALLQAEGNIISRFKLRDFVWGKHPPRMWLNSLRVTISTLKPRLRVGGYDLLCRPGIGYSLRRKESET
jgi:DNA-binding winged helix-turn-helix (wHTH) protein